MRKKIYLTLSYLTPIFVLLAAYFLGARQYLLALEASIIVVVLMESRVQVGKRIVRTSTFWIHIPASVLYLALLAWMTFWPHPTLLYPIVEVFFVISVCAGSMLWWKGIQDARA
jgi:hypothetical protein